MKSIVLVFLLSGLTTLYAGENFWQTAYEASVNEELRAQKIAILKKDKNLLKEVKKGLNDKNQKLSIFVIKNLKLSQFQEDLYKLFISSKDFHILSAYLTVQTNRQKAIKRLKAIVVGAYKADVVGVASLGLIQLNYTFTDKETHQLLNSENPHIKILISEYLMDRMFKDKAFDFNQLSRILTMKPYQVRLNAFEETLKNKSKLSASQLKELQRKCLMEKNNQVKMICKKL